MGADVPPFDEACRQFHEFLTGQGITGELAWVFRGDVSSHQRTLSVRLPLSADNTSRARDRYELGRQRGLGVWLQVFGRLGERPLCYVWLPADAEDASYAMLSGLKMSVPETPLEVRPVISGLRWWFRRRWDWWRGFTGLADDVPAGPAPSVNVLHRPRPN